MLAKTNFKILLDFEILHNLQLSELHQHKIAENLLKSGRSILILIN